MSMLGQSKVVMNLLLNEEAVLVYFATKLVVTNVELYVCNFIFKFL